jgi:hypothetical protein
MATQNADNFSNPIAVSNGGTGVASLVAYEPLVGGTTSTAAIGQASTGFSTSGNALMSNGASHIPGWYFPGGSLVKLNAQTVVGATNIVFNNTFITSAYSNYMLVFQNIDISSSGANFEFLVSTNNGSTTLATGYQTGVMEAQFTFAAESIAAATTFAYIASGVGGASSISTGVMYLNIPQSAAFSYWGESFFRSAASYRMRYWGCNTGTTTINYLLFKGSAGTITGTMTLYGIRS